MKSIFISISLLLMTSIMIAQPSSKEQLSPSNVDYSSFSKLTVEVEQLRLDRLISIHEFNTMAQEENTIILDTRSKAAFDRKHFKGAIHLNFSDFTTEKLAKVIPSKNTRILIYCNNNISNDPQNFPGKLPPLALNIPTFINLVGYGYENIYELENLLEEDYALLAFEGTDVPK